MGLHKNILTHSECDCKNFFVIALFPPAQLLPDVVNVVRSAIALRRAEAASRLINNGDFGVVACLCCTVLVPPPSSLDKLHPFHPRRASRRRQKVPRVGTPCCRFSRGRGEPATLPFQRKKAPMPIISLCALEFA